MVTSYCSIWSGSFGSYVATSDLMFLIAEHVEADGNGSKELRDLQAHILEFMNQHPDGRTSPPNDPTVPEQIEALSKLVDWEA